MSNEQTTGPLNGNEIEEDKAQRSDSVANTLASKLQQAIARGQFKIGNSLPSERELMIQFQVSRTTVREALRMLSAKGMIEVKRGRKGGSFITKPSHGSVVQSLDLFIRGQNIRYIDLLFVREAIEPAAAAQAAMCRTEEKLEQLRLLCLECESNFGDVQQFVDTNVKWHLAVAEASNNPLFVAFLSAISNTLHASTNLAEFDIKTRKTVVGVHWQIFEAIRVGDPEAARRRMMRHLTAYGERLTTINLS